MFLGLLYPEEGHRVYGWTTNTKVTIIIIYDEAVRVNDEDVPQILKRLHEAYIAAVCNPFHTEGNLLQSK